MSHSKSKLERLSKGIDTKAVSRLATIMESSPLTHKYQGGSKIALTK